MLTQLILYHADAKIDYIPLSVGQAEEALAMMFGCLEDFNLQQIKIFQHLWLHGLAT